MKRFLGSIIDKYAFACHIILSLFAFLFALFIYIAPKESSDDKLITGILIVFA